MSAQKIWMVAGGTGGHVFPGITIAQALIKQGIIVRWIGTPQGIESRVVPLFKIPCTFISARPLRGQSRWRCLLNVCAMSVSLFQVMYELLRDRPQAIISMGGFVAAPVGLMAYFFRIPLILHEQNAILGSTQRVLMRWAQQCLAAYPNVFPDHLSPVVTGNPVRASIGAIKQKRDMDHSKPLRCLVLGGSQGAHAINTMISKAYLEMPLNERPHLWHQTGAQDVQALQMVYQSDSKPVRVDAFIEEMAEAYAWADVVIARSGAMTCAECRAVGLPTAWVPYPKAIDQHQLANACYELQMNLGWIWLEADWDTQHVIEWWRYCQLHLQSLRTRGLEQCGPNATDLIVQSIQSILITSVE